MEGEGTGVTQHAVTRTERPQIKNRQGWPGWKAGLAVPWGGGQCGLLDLLGDSGVSEQVQSQGGVWCAVQAPQRGLRQAGDLGGLGRTGFHYTGELLLCNKLSPAWKLRTSPVTMSVSVVKSLGAAEPGPVLRVSQGGGQAEFLWSPGPPSSSCGCFLLSQAEPLLSYLLTPQCLLYEK